MIYIVILTLVKNMSEILSQVWAAWEEIINFLKDFWLTKNEIDIYLASLSMWQNTASRLWIKVGTKRSTAQYCCQSLVKKKMMSMIQKDNYFLFWAENPDKILRSLKSEEEKIKKQQKQAEKVIQNLNSVINPLSSIPKIKYYQWVEGLIEVLQQTIESNESVYSAINIENSVNPELKKYILRNYVGKRAEFIKKSYAIFSDSEFTREYSSLDKQMNRVSIFVNKKDFVFGTCMQICWNKVIFFSITKNDLTGIVIEDESIRATQFAIYKMAWQLAQTKWITTKEIASMPLEE